MLKTIKQWTSDVMRPMFLTVIAALLLPGFSLAQENVFDFTDFDCWKIRRSGETLELDRLTSDGPVPTRFHCNGRSCVNREVILAKDGSISEIYRQIYIPRDKTEYISTWAMWKEGSEAPAIHRSTVYQLVECKIQDTDN